jgi:hypothetical protein
LHSYADAGETIIMTESVKKQKNSIFKWGDIAILAVFLAAVALTVYFAAKPAGGVVEIYKNGILRYSYPLSQNRQIELDEDGKNLIVIKDGRVYVEAADCVGQDCVHAQPVSNSGGMIVCLPNKVVIRVVASDIDAIT